LIGGVGGFIAKLGLQCWVPLELAARGGFIEILRHV
jgi:hypothetical protein